MVLSCFVAIALISINDGSILSRNAWQSDEVKIDKYVNKVYLTGCLEENHHAPK